MHLRFLIHAASLSLARSANSLGSQQYIANNGSVLEERIVSVNSDGQPSAFSSTSASTCAVALGCFRPLPSRRPTLISQPLPVSNPLACFDACASKGFKFTATSGTVCACSQTLFSSFQPVTNPDCSTADDLWTVFACFTYEKLSSLAVDPWRNIAFKVVIVDWFIEDPMSPLPLGQNRESYFLFASDVTSSKPLPEFSLALGPDAVLSGLVFDVDSSRLVALSSSAAEFRFRLAVIGIDSSDPFRPRLVLSQFTLFTDVQTKEDIFQVSLDSVAGDQVSGIISRNGLDTYVFSLPNAAKSTLLFVDLSNSRLGHVFHTVGLDCVATQLAINEYYGDVAVLASRQGSVQFIAVATVFRAANGQLAVHSYWDPTGANLLFVASVADTQNLNLIAGVSVSIPMQNQSCHGIMLYDTATQYGDDRQVLLNQPLSSSDARSGSVPSVVCFDIRHQGLFALWGSANGTARTVENGTVQTAVTMNLYQSDPGFPMTLSRPEMTACELSMTGLVASVKFDAVTLMGGLAVDKDKDGIPDTADLSTQVLTPQPANVCFAESSISKLTGATCQFVQSDLLVLTLDQHLSSLTFNDALCIRPNFLCRNSGLQWSNYANGCCTVSLPRDVLPPKPVLSAVPALVVDVCSDVVLDLGDSLNCGRTCLFTWSVSRVEPIVAAVGNSALVLSALTALLQSHPNTNASLTIPSSILMSGAKHVLSVTLTSWWKLSTTLNVTVEKLTQPAPTVTVQGDAKVVRTQMTDYSIVAAGRVSGCSAVASSSQPLTYQWTMSNCSVVLAKQTNVIANQNVLRIPAGTHVCPPVGAWIDANKVVCEQCVATVSVTLSDQGLRSSPQSVTVQIVKSPIVVKCVNPDSALITKGPAWFVNCGNSIDPDNPTTAPFQGSFLFSCVTGSGKPCFGTSKSLVDISTCVTDYTQPRVVGDGGALYPQIVFNATEQFCRVSRGVMAVNTALLAEGTYTVTVEAVHFDGLRTASKSLSVELSSVVMPKVSLAIVSGSPSGANKYPVSQALKVEAVTTAALKYTWTLLSKQRNEAYDADTARLFLARGDPYPVVQFVYLAVSTLAACKAANKAQWTDTSPTLAIGSNCLQVGTQYALRLNVTFADAAAPAIQLTTFSELLFETASGPPRNGGLNVTSAGPTCDLPKTLSADGWSSEDAPLLYRFGYMAEGGVKYWLSDSAQQARSFTSLLPCGRVTVFVQIVSSAGESVFSFADVSSVLPVDVSTAAAAILSRAESLVTSDPAQAFSQFMAAVSLNSTANTVARVATAVAQTQCASADCGDRQLVFLNTLAATVANSPETIAPHLVEGLIQAIEQNVERISLTSSAGLEQTQTIFNSLSAITGSFGFSSPAPVVRAAKRSAVEGAGVALIPNCETVLCKTVGEVCMKQLTVGHAKEICCDSVNAAYGCVEPPCWFQADIGCHPEVTATTEQTENVTMRISKMSSVENGQLEDARIINAQSRSVRPTRSQTIEMQARMVAARDRLLKKVIVSLVKDQPPVVFNTTFFRITVGKTTDMNSTLPSLEFPRSFTVPNNSPDSPSAENPVTGFSFMFVEHFSNPFSVDSGSFISVSVMKANPDIPLVVSSTAPPIRIFANQDLFPSHRCLGWSGDAWSGSGAVNDARGCLVSKFGDFGLFLDTTAVLANETVSSAVGDDSFSSNRFDLSVSAIAVFVALALVHAALAAWARHMDKVTEDAPTTIHLDGDGISTPLSIDDPIPYDRPDAGMWVLVWSTAARVCGNQHVLAWPLKFHPIVTRPQRVLLSFILTAACMDAASLLVYASSASPVLIGLVSSMVASPLYLLFRFMLTHRPHPAALRPAKGLRRAKPMPLAPGPPPTPRDVDLRFGMMPVGPPVRLLSRSPRDSSVPPPPPPPLAEDTPVFIRRVQNVYSEKSQHEHLKTIIAADNVGVHHPVPQWVELASVIVICSALAGMICVSAVVVCVTQVAYLESAFLLAFATALFSSVFLMETVTLVISTLMHVSRFKLRMGESDQAHSNPQRWNRPDTVSSLASDGQRANPPRSATRTQSPVWLSPTVHSREHSPAARSPVLGQGVLLPGRIDFALNRPGSPRPPPTPN